MMVSIRVLGISGSPRKERNTEFLLTTALQASSEIEEVQTELVRISDFQIIPCNGCNMCVREARCPLDEKDDMGKLRTKIQEADALVFAAPSYFASVPGVMKNFMDRSRPLKMQKHALQGKVVSALSVSGLRNGGGEAVIDEIVRFGLSHGMIAVGACGDPLTDSTFGIGSLQADKGWRRTSEDDLALQGSRNVGKRVAEIALALKQKV